MFWKRRKEKTKSSKVKKTSPPKQFVPKETPPKWKPTYNPVPLKHVEEKNTEKPEPRIDWERKFLKSFQKLTHSHRVWDVWRDYIVLHACAISNAFDKENYERREKRYLDIIHRYGKEEQEIFPALAADTLMALNDNQEQDFLGKMFMDLGLSNHSNGQFFTPYHVCELMAELTMDDAVEKIEKQGYISINDPCCGAGATLIAGAHAIRKRLEKCEHPLNYQNHILMVGQDVDETVALMCYIQLSLLGLAGFIKIGNSITNPMSPDDSSENYWYTPMYFSDIWNTRRVIKSVTKLLEGGDQ